MFRDKKYVIEVWREKSFSKAANRLYVSQPSLSAKIKKIEEEIGAQIFDRSTSPLRLTEFGKIYIDAIEEVNQIERRVENALNDMNTLHSGELSIGASNVFAAYVLPPMIAEFKSRFPNVKIRLIEGNTTDIEALISNNEVDMVIDNNSYGGELYEKRKYTSERILLAVPKNFEACRAVSGYELSEDDVKNKRYLKADFPAVPLSAFSKTPFVLLTPNNDTRTRGERMCREAGFRPIVALEVHQQATAYMIAATKMGATFVSDTMVEKLPSYENLNYYKLSGEDSERTVFFTMKRNKQKNKAMEEFIKLISSEG